MKFTPVERVEVFYTPADIPQRVGVLALKNRQIWFEYDTDFIETGLELSPLKLPLKPGMILSEERIFDGLFGVFNDSLPDGWGRLLLDRQLISQGINPQSLSALDRLCFVGDHGMGALRYKPDYGDVPTVNQVDLDQVADEVQAFQANNEDQFVEDLMKLAGSSAGARPKVLLEIEGIHWLIKFRSSSDLQDLSAIEYAYHLMAKTAGLALPEACLFPARQGSGYFGVKRFDRLSKVESVHMHSLSGLLHADHTVPCLDYEMVMKATLYLTKDQREHEKQFRQAVFNVLAHNRDDHAKNFSFLMDVAGTWQISPAYDLTFSSGPNGEHCTMVMGEGKRPGKSQLLRLANVAGLNEQSALAVIEEVQVAVANWRTFADEAGVSKASTKLIADVLKF